MNAILSNIAHFKVKHLHLDGHLSLGLYGRPEMTQAALEALQRTNLTLAALILPRCFDLYREDLNILLDLNLAGRILLHDDDNVEQIKIPALWPLVMRRINTVRLTGGSLQHKRKQTIRRAGMMYFMLRQRLLLKK